MARSSVQNHHLIVIAILPFILLLGLRAILGDSAGLFSRSGPDSAPVTTKDNHHDPTAAALSGDKDQEQNQDDLFCDTSSSSSSSMSPAAVTIADIASSLLAQRDLDLVSCRTIQSLWAGYGHICAVQAAPRRGDREGEEKGPSLILKYISPPVSADITDEGHLRKVLSYQVEQYFYTHLAPLLPESVAVAECIASINDGQTTAIVLKDLKSSSTNPVIKPSTAFPVALEKRGQLNSDQTFAALDWLAGFHGYSWTATAQLRQREHALRPPLEEAAKQQRIHAASDHNGHGSGALFDVKGVWLNGGYTYLATRRREYESLARDDDDSEWSAILCSPSPGGGPSLAERVAAYLTPTVDSSAPGPAFEYETLIHGDVKSENMFASADGRSVAFVDFQYVGFGLGVCDLAKLFTCSVPLSMLVGRHVAAHDGHLEGEELEMQPEESRLLSHYLQALKTASGKDYPWDLFVKHWEAALVDWLRFQASWGFWGNTAWLEARVRHIVKHIDI